MTIRVSGCYYHPDRGAVAVCDECGVGVCRECAVKVDNGRILCKACADNELRDDHKQYRNWLKERGGRFVEITDFVRPGIIGVFLVVLVVIIGHFTGDSLFREGTLFGIMTAYFLFSIPYCYTLLNTLIAPKTYVRYGLIASTPIRTMLKMIISVMTGWIVFPIIVIRFAFKKVKSQKRISNQDKF